MGAVDTGAVDAAKKRSSGKSKGSKSKSRRGGVREEIRELQEALGVDDPNRTPQVNHRLSQRMAHGRKQRIGSSWCAVFFRAA